MINIFRMIAEMVEIEIVIRWGLKMADLLSQQLLLLHEFQQLMWSQV